MTNILGLATQYWMYIAIGVVLVVMIVLTIIPQRKRQKEQKAMMDSITVGTKIMTIGRMVGKITQVNADNTLIVNVGTENSPTYIVIDRQAVGLVLEAVPVAAPAPVVEEAPAAEEAAQDEVVEDTAAEAPVEEAVVVDAAEEDKKDAE